MRSVCVFCGSSMGARPEYEEAARELGRALGEQGLRLVYGGGQVGLMGIVARTAKEHGAPVVRTNPAPPERPRPALERCCCCCCCCWVSQLGIIPAAMDSPEVGATVGEAIVVDTMHERKRLCEEHSDGFVALPGGLGTLEEVFEVACHAQLGIHRKPVGLLDVQGFYTPLLHFLDHTVQEGFVKEHHRKQILLAHSDAAQLLQLLQSAEPVQEPHFAPAKWGRTTSNFVEPFPHEEEAPPLQALPEEH